MGIELRNPAAFAKWVLVSVGVIFIVTGLIVTSMYLGGVIPQGYNWQGPTFLALGLAGVSVSVLDLRDGKRWPLLLLGALYIPWTVIGLVGDTNRGLWPLALGEALGLLAVSWALVTAWRKAI